MRKILSNILFIFKLPYLLVKWIFKTIHNWVARTKAEIHSVFEEEVEDTPVMEAMGKAVANPSELLYHLNDLRIHLFRAVVALAIMTAFAFIFCRQIMNFLALPIGGINSLTAVEVTEPIGTSMKVAFLAGFTLAFPYIAFELWLFVAPGLSVRSRVFVLKAIPIAMLFFVGGMAFAYFVMIPPAMGMLLHFMGINTIARPSSYFGFTANIMFWIGVAFEFPLIIFVLARIGLVKWEMLWKQWKLAIVIIAVIAAMITPTVDPVNMTIAMAPMVLLYFLSIFLARIAQAARIDERSKSEAES